MAIEKGKTIAFEYTLTVDGEEMDSSKGRGPLEYTHGDDSLIPGLTRRMEGMEEGEERKIEVPKEEAYGPVNPEALKEIPRDKLPQEIKIEIGTMLEAQGKDGMTFPVKVTGIKDDSVTVDFNHPLAGKSLTFVVKVVSIK